jgi:hypothetical protein
MQVGYSEEDCKDLAIIAKEIANRIFILTRCNNNAMSIKTAFIHIKNMELSTDYREIAKILKTTFETRNDRKIFEFQNSRYYISHKFYKFFNLDFIEFTIEITLDE